MNVLIIANKFDTYSTRRITDILKTRNHNVNFLSPFDCILRLKDGEFDVISSKFDVLEPDVVLLRTTAYSDFGVRVGRTLETFLGTHLKMRGTICINDPESKTSAGNKFLALQILSKAGVPVPATFLTWDTNIERVVHETLGTPFVVKTNEGTWGEGVKLAPDIETANLMFQEARNEMRVTVAQKYIRGKQDIRVMVIGGQAIAAIQRVPSLNEFRSNFHKGGQAENFNLPQDYAKIAVDAAQALELEIAGVDILGTDAGPVVLEANPSPGLEQIEKVTNIDIATKITEHLEAKYLGIT